MSRNSSTALGNVPKDLQEHVRNLLSITPTLRPDVHMLSKVGATAKPMCDVWMCGTLVGHVLQLLM